MTLNHTATGRPLVTSEQRALRECEPAFENPPSDAAFSAAHGATDGDDEAERLAELRFRRELNEPREPWPGAANKDGDY